MRMLTTAMRGVDKVAFNTALKSRGLTVSSLSRAVATNERYLRSIVAGMTPGPLMRARIAEQLQLAEDELFPFEPPLTASVPSTPSERP